VPSPALSATYLRQVDELRAAVLRRVEAEYAIDEGAILDSFGDYIERVEPILASGQASIQRLTDGYLRTAMLEDLDELVEVEPGPFAGTTAAGAPLAEGMAAWGPMVLGQIGAGANVKEALDFGGFLARRFTDGELLATADRELGYQSTTGRLRIIGWDGVSGGGCGPCGANGGFHPVG
jgi:hypothetical protein